MNPETALKFSFFRFTCKNKNTCVLLVSRPVEQGVVSIRHFRAFHAIFVPLEYIPIIPPHSCYVSANVAGG